MALYSRRILQRLINENDQFLLDGQTKSHVQQLNRMPKEITLAYEWEIVLLNALSKVGNVVHERNFGGSRNADIYFEAFNNPKANFVADITSISDKGADKINPFEDLSNTLRKLVKEFGLKPSSFNLKVGRHPGPTFKGGHKVRLKLPGRARFLQTIFGKEFDAFIHRILGKPKEADRFEVKTDDADVEISYIPNQRYSIGEYPSYTVLNSITDNTIYQALENKASQLIGTNFRGPLGIFLCDGGSRLFSEISTAGLSYTMDDIIKDFLLYNEEIHFIVTFTTERKNPYATFPLKDNPYITYIRFFKGQKSNQIAFDVEATLNKMVGWLPFPESEPRNALNFLKGMNPNVGRSNWGGLELISDQNNTKVKISARALAELLAGKVDQIEFFKAHRFIPSDLRKTDAENPFNIALKRGQLIHKVSIEKLESEDDDWITFDLKGPDPAISPFTVPTKSKKPVKKL